MTETRARRVAVWALCLIGGVAVGVAGFNSESNHPTYLPPALHYLDPTYLAHDWWLGSAKHYHFAFFALVTILAKLQILEIGLAGLNILTVATAIYTCHRIMRLLRPESGMVSLALFIAMFLTTRTFFSAGDSYLFAPSLQPSSLAATATLVAIYNLLARRLGRCGLWLLAAGLFHVNFLVANIPLFGLAYLVLLLQEHSPRRLVGKDVVLDFAKILGPSLVLVAAFAPLILSVAAEQLSPSDAAKADWIFFRFGVAFHYFPLSYLPHLAVFFCWEALGFLWTARAVPDPAQRRIVWAIQIAFALIIWSATALTTFVFLAPVSRLYLWRLAPFAMLFSVLLTIVGVSRLIRPEAGSPEPAPRDTIALLASFALVPIVLVPAFVVYDQVLSTAGRSPAAIVLALLLAAACLCTWLRLPPPSGRWLAASTAAGLISFAVVTQPDNRRDSRYSLIVPSQDRRQQAELFAFVRRSTPRDALFLVPPGLDYFRLESERAVVVDFKAMPIDRLALIEWYRRLARISGTDRPASTGAVSAGFETIDAARLESLRREFGATYVVLRSEDRPHAPGWDQVFRNQSYRVLAYGGLP